MMTSILGAEVALLSSSVVLLGIWVVDIKLSDVFVVAWGVVGVGIVVKFEIDVLAMNDFSVVISPIVVVSSIEVDFSVAAIVDTDVGAWVDTAVDGSSVIAIVVKAAELDVGA